MNPKFKAILRAVLSVVACLVMALACACTGDDDNGSGTVKLIVKVPNLTINSITKPDIKNGEGFFKAAGEAFAKQYDKYKIEIEVKVFPVGEEETFITEMFDTSDAVDVLYDEFFNMISYVYTGRVVPLDDILTEASRADLKQSYVDMGIVENRIYMMPYMGRQNILIYNKDIFGECGLERFFADGDEPVIQNWEISEWNTILDTLAQYLSGKTDKAYAPVMMYANSSDGDAHTMTLVRAFGSQLFTADGYFDFGDERAVDALEWLESGLERGWYMPHAQTLTLTDCTKLFEAGQLAINVFNIGSDLYSTGDMSRYGFVNFPGNVATRFASGFEVFDNGDSAKLTVAKDFVKFIYDTREWLEVSAGSIPASSSVAEMPEYNALPLTGEFEKNVVNVVDFLHGNPNWQGRSNSVRNVFYVNLANMLAGRITAAECARVLNEALNAATRYGYEHSSPLHT